MAWQFPDFITSNTRPLRALVLTNVTTILTAILTTIVLSVGTVFPAQAGAFLQGPGQGQVIFSTFSEGASSAFDTHGRIIPITSWMKFEMGASLEYGATDWATLLVSAARDQVTASQSVSVLSGDYLTTSSRAITASGLGPAAAGVRLRLWQAGPAVVSVEANLRLPGAANLALTTPLPTQTQVEMRLQAGSSFAVWGVEGYGDGAFGVRLPVGVGAPSPSPGHVSAVVLDLTLGLRPTNKLLLLLQEFGTLAPRTMAWLSQTALPQQISSKVQPSAVWEINPHLFFQLGGFVTACARNAAFERGLISSAWMRF